MAKSKIIQLGGIQPESSDNTLAGAVRAIDNPPAQINPRTGLPAASYSRGGSGGSSGGGGYSASSGGGVSGTATDAQATAEVKKAEANIQRQKEALLFQYNKGKALATNRSELRQVTRDYNSISNELARRQNEINAIKQQSLITPLSSEGFNLSDKKLITPTDNRTYSRGTMTNFDINKLIPNLSVQSQKALTSEQGFTKEEIAAAKRLARQSKISNITGAVTKVTDLAPTAEDILTSDLLTKDYGAKPLIPETPTTTIDVITNRSLGATPSGTMILSPREKTLAEKLNIPVDNDYNNLKVKYDNIMSRYGEEKITSLQADTELDKAIHDYTSVKIVKGIPKVAAYGLAIGAISAINPFAGRIINTAFGGMAFLNRRAIAERFKQFPAESALEAGTLITAGLVGNVAGRKISNLKNPEINAETFSKPINLAGNERTQAINIAVENAAPNIQALIRQGKLSATNAFTAVTNDGREITIVSLSSAKSGEAGMLKGQDVIIGYETISKGILGRRFLGKSTSVINREGSESLIQGYTFKVADNRVAKILERLGFKNKPVEFVIAERTNQIASRETPIGRLTATTTESRILKNSAVDRELARRVRSVQTKLDKGQKVGLSELKNLINLEGRSNGLKPFTEQEFQASNVGQLTNAQILTIINRATLRGVVNVTDMLRAKKVGYDIRETSLGKAIVKPLKIEKKLVKKSSVKLKEAPSIMRKPKTPLSRTFEFERKLHPEIKQEPYITPETKQIKISRGISSRGFGTLLAFKKPTTKAFGKSAGAGLKSTNLLGKAYPKSVSESGISKGTFAGKHQYERTQTTPAFEQIDYKKATDFGQMFGTKQGSGTNLKAYEDISLGLKHKTKTSLAIMPKVKDELRTYSDIGIKTPSKLKQPQRFRVPQRLRTQKPPRLRNPSVPKSPRVPMFPLKPRLSVIEKTKHFKLKAFNRPEKFDVYTRKGQRLSSVPLSKKAALGLGARKTDIGIRASFFIIPTTRPGYAKPRSLEREFERRAFKFRPSKRTAGLIVEKPKYRLEAKGRTKEVWEINAFRKSPKPFSKKKT